jgi:hypothetical protein
MNDEMKCFQWSVYSKVENQTEFEYKNGQRLTAAFLPSFRRNIQEDFRVGSPHEPLYYLDDGDAEFWGKLFALHLLPWMERFCASPETLDGYMWRVHWT